MCLNVVTQACLNQLGGLGTTRGGGLDGGRGLVVGTVMVKGKDQQGHYRWNLKSDEPKPTDETKQEYGTTLALGRPNMELPDHSSRIAPVLVLLQLILLSNILRLAIILIETKTQTIELN